MEGVSVSSPGIWEIEVTGSGPVAILACRDCGHDVVTRVNEVPSMPMCRDCGGPMRVRLVVPSTALAVWGEEEEVGEAGENGVPGQDWPFYGEVLVPLGEEVE